MENHYKTIKLSEVSALPAGFLEKTKLGEGASRW